MSHYDNLPKGYESEYLMRGFAKNVMNVGTLEIDIEKGTACANVDFEDPFIESDGKFLLHYDTIHRIMSQVIDAFICKLFNMDKPQIGAVLGSHIDISIRRPIRNPEGIKVEVKYIEYRRTKRRLVGKFEIKINNTDCQGSVMGSIRQPSGGLPDLLKR